MEKVSYENPFTGEKVKKPDLLEALKEKYGDKNIIKLRKPDDRHCLVSDDEEVSEDK